MDVRQIVSEVNLIHDPLSFLTGETPLIYAAQNLSAHLPADSQRHLKEGFSRRLLIMHTNVRELARIAPADRKSHLRGNEPSEVNVHLNSYYIHLRGCLDNLAWAVQYALQPLGPGGEENRDIVRNCHLFRAKFIGVLRIENEALADELESYLEWASEVKKRRDPIAHRVPLYIPPGVVDLRDKPKVEELHNQVVSAFQSGDLKGGMAILDEARALGTYSPLIVLSGPKGLSLLPLNETISEDHRRLFAVAGSVFRGLGVGTA